MKIKSIFWAAGLCCSFFKSQIGINTIDPMTMLDVNGNTRIRSASVLPTSESVDKIMIFDSNNVINTIKTDRIFEKSPYGQSIIKGIGGSGFSVLSLSILAGWQKVAFPTLEINEGLNYDVASQEFTAPETGLYNVYFFIEFASLSSASTLGAGIFKINSGSASAALIADESFLNISVLGINVSSPVRKTQTIIKLNKGDKIVFGAKVPLVDIGLFTNSKALFTIWRMK